MITYLSCHRFYCIRMLRGFFIRALLGSTPYHLVDVHKVIHVQQVEVHVVSAVGLTVHAQHVLEGSFFQVGEDPSVHQQHHSVQRRQSETQGEYNGCVCVRLFD